MAPAAARRATGMQARRVQSVGRPARKADEFDMLAHQISPPIRVLDMETIGHRIKVWALSLQG